MIHPLQPRITPSQPTNSFGNSHQQYPHSSAGNESLPALKRLQGRLCQGCHWYPPSCFRCRVLPDPPTLKCGFHHGPILRHGGHIRSNFVLTWPINILFIDQAFSWRVCLNGYSSAQGNAHMVNDDPYALLDYHP